MLGNGVGWMLFFAIYGLILCGAIYANVLMEADEREEAEEERVRLRAFVKNLTKGADAMTAAEFPRG